MDKSTAKQRLEDSVRHEDPFLRGVMRGFVLQLDATDADPAAIVEEAEAYIAELRRRERAEQRWADAEMGGPAPGRR